jgi:AraC-like DNA-binding protein
MAYSEFRSRPELSELVVCTWERSVPPDGAAATRVLPDGCVDLLWRGGELLVAGPDRAYFISPPEPGETVVGLRLRPGVAGPALGLAASELRDARVPIADLWGRAGAELRERIGDAAGGRLRRRLLEQALLARLRGAREPDPLVLAATRSLGRPGIRVGALSRALATSERRLRRRFETDVGYGPKTLDRVLRLQRFLSIAPTIARGRLGLARVAAELGYADQAHLTREAVRLAGLTPAQLVTRSIAGSG